MANIKKEMRRQFEANILQSFKGNGRPTAADREAAAVIAARTTEILESRKRQEGKRK